MMKKDTHRRRGVAVDVSMIRRGPHVWRKRAAASVRMPDARGHLRAPRFRFVRRFLRPSPRCRNRASDWTAPARCRCWRAL
eukprot:9474084-Pyramimonas_sp.AAC.1